MVSTVELKYREWRKSVQEDVNAAALSEAAREILEVAEPLLKNAFLKGYQEGLERAAEISTQALQVVCR